MWRASVGPSGGVLSVTVSGCIGVGRECRYSGGQQGYRSYEGHWGLLGGVVVSGGLGAVREIGTIKRCWGALGAGREYRYSGASRGIGGIRRLLGGIRVEGVRGNWGCQGELGLSEGVGGVRGTLGGWWGV